MQSYNTNNETFINKVFIKIYKSPEPKAKTSQTQ